MASLLKKYQPESFEALSQLAKETMKDGALSAKTKELMAISLSIATNCEPCVKIHTRRALQLGSSAEEIAETIGVAWNGVAGRTNCRLSYVRLVDGVAFRNDENVRDVNEHFLIGDWNVKFQDCDFGVHYYSIYGKIFDNAVVDLNHSWIGIHGNGHWLGLLWHGVILYQNGDTKYAAQPKRHNDGWLYRLEAKWEGKDRTFQVLGMHSTGGRDGSGFQTLHQIIHTQGYWAYTHIFTCDDPSDVNEYALEPGNLGYGLNSLQAKFQCALPFNIQLTSSAAWYGSDVAMPAFTKQASKTIGSELAAILTFPLSDNLALDAGAALTFLGEAGKNMYQGYDMNQVNEIFSRFQFVF